MGDNSTSAAEDSVDQNKEQIGKPSIDILKEAKPEPDISIREAKKESSESEGEKSEAQEEASPEPKPEGPAKIETVFEKLDMSSDKSDSTTDSAVIESPVKSKATVDVPPLEFEIKETMSPTKNDKMASDIFSLKDVDVKQKNVNSIWSISGAPSGRINRRKDMTSSIFPAGCMGCKDQPPNEQASPRRFIDASEAQKDFVGHIDNTPRKRPSSSKPRNPLTGAGCDDDIVRTSSRRKDGNPLLGVGYDDKKPITAQSATRIPPGGYSQGLW